MNQNILKPLSASRRWKATRRKRTRLPEITRSRSSKNRLMWVETKTYVRDNPVNSRSKYEPHVGKKQLARRPQ